MGWDLEVRGSAFGLSGQEVDYELRAEHYYGDNATKTEIRIGRNKDCFLHGEYSLVHEFKRDTDGSLLIVFYGGWERSEFLLAMEAICHHLRAFEAPGFQGDEGGSIRKETIIKKEKIKTEYSGPAYGAVRENTLAEKLLSPNH